MEEPMVAAGASTGGGTEIPFLDLYGEAYRDDPHAVLRAGRESSPYVQTGGPRACGSGGPPVLIQGITEGPLVEAMWGCC